MTKMRKTLREDNLTDLDINREKHSAYLKELRCDGVELH